MNETIALNKERNIYRITIALIWTMMLASIALRISLFETRDYFRDIQYFIKYYHLLKNNSYETIMSHHFSKISSAYLYLWYPLTFIKASPLYLIKLCTVFFDGLCAYWGYRIAKLSHSTGIIPWIVALIIMWLPVSWLNSSAWGQIDSVYSSFVIASVYFLMRMQSDQAKKHDPLWAIIFFSIAFCFKLQTVLMAPTFCFLVGARLLPIYYGAIPFASYILMQMPRVIVGYPFANTFLGYKQQIDKWYGISKRAINPYHFIQKHGSWHDIHLADKIGTYTGIGLCVIALVIGWQLRKRLFSSYHMLLISCSAYLMSYYISTRMHERYFYVPLVLSVLLPLYKRTLVLIPVVLNIMVLVPYIACLKFASQSQVKLLYRHLDTCVYIMSVVMLFLVIELWREMRNTTNRV